MAGDEIASGLLEGFVADDVVGELLLRLRKGGPCAPVYAVNLCKWWKGKLSGLLEKALFTSKE